MGEGEGASIVYLVVIIDQWSQTARLYEIQVTVICSLAILVTVTSECYVNMNILKTGTETFANSANQNQTQQNTESGQDLDCLLKLQEVKG